MKGGVRMSANDAAFSRRGDTAATKVRRMQAERRVVEKVRGSESAEWDATPADLREDHMKTMETPLSFASLSREHSELDRLFNKHQRALFTRNLDKAISRLADFRGRLRGHIDYEERRLLPLYADVGAETPGGTLQIFQAEHSKLLDWVEKLEKLTGELSRSEDLTGSILVLLDEESAFKGLFHHHAAREENLLFPRLDKRTTEEERKTWLVREP
jgi:hemerythrin-like domain-containing protein